MATWEWVGRGSVSKSLADVPTDTALDYGTTYTYDKRAPIEEWEFQGKGLTWGEVNALRLKVLEKDSEHTLTDSVGSGHTGIPIALSWESDPILGSGLYIATLKMRK